MTDLDRLRDAVVQAARNVAMLWAEGKSYDMNEIRVALAALAGYQQAHTAQRATAETVMVELWAHKDGDIAVLLPGSFIARDWATNKFRTRLGTTTLRLDTEAAG